jgi:hypothetical protein
MYTAQKQSSVVGLDVPNHEFLASVLAVNASE